MKVRPGRLLCQLIRIEEGIALISTKQYDETPVYAYCLPSKLDMCFKNPNCRFLEVRVGEKKDGKVLIGWDVVCACMDTCPGDVFWVPESSLAQ